MRADDGANRLQMTALPETARFRTARLRSVLELGAVFTSRGLAGLGGVALSASVARLTGADGLGQFTVVYNAVTLAALLSRAGLDMSLVREIAASLSRQSVSDLARMFLYALRVSSALAATASILVFIAAKVFLDARTGAELLSLMAFATLPLAALALVSGYLKGRRRASAAAFLDGGGLLLAASGVLWLLSFGGADVGVRTVALVFVAMTAATALAAVFWVLRDASRQAGKADPSLAPLPFDRGRLRSGALDFLMITVAGYLTQAGSFVIVAPFLDDHALGLARAAERMSLLIVFALTAINPFIAPRIVHHVTRDERVLLRRLVFRATWLSAGLAVPLALVLVLAPGWVLSLFGDGFGEAAPMLIVFALAQVATAVTGPCAMLLSMNGQEGSFRRILVGGLLVSGVAFPIAAWACGPMGFVSAYALIMVAKSGLIMHAAKAALGGRLVMAGAPEVSRR